MAALAADETVGEPIGAGPGEDMKAENVRKSDEAKRSSADSKGKILSMKFWYLHDHVGSSTNNTRSSMERRKNEQPVINNEKDHYDDVNFGDNPTIDVIDAHSLEGINVNDRNSGTVSFSRTFVNIYALQSKKSHRAKHIAFGVFLGIFAIIAISMAVLYIHDDNEDNDDPTASAGNSEGTERAGSNPGNLNYPCQTPGLCSGNGTCVDIVPLKSDDEDDATSIKGHVCLCNAPYRGENCESNVCSFKPCRNGEVCQMGSDDVPACRVPSGPNVCEDLERLRGRRMVTSPPLPGAALVMHGGDVSEVDVRMRCQNDALCVPYPVDFDGVHSEFACVCKKYNYGLRCEGSVLGLIAQIEAGNTEDNPEISRAEAPQPLPCESARCLNGASCTNLNTLHYKCICVEGFDGDQCERKLSPCEMTTCINGAKCEDKGDVAFCACPPQFHGQNCQYTNACTSNPCKSSGTCKPVGEGEYVCNCPNEYMGKHCEVFNPCSSSPCLNNGRCTHTSPSKDNIASSLTYRCQCDTQRFVGENCGDVSPCSSNPCLNGGVCKPETRFHAGKSVTTYRCDCDWQRWVGDKCERTSPCFSSPCQNGAHCKLRMDMKSRTCQCKFGYKGDDCEIHYGDN